MRNRVEASEAVCSQLHTWGAWRREEQLCKETLGWLPERSQKAAAFQHQRGIIAQLRGDYEDALRCYRQTLEIFEALDNRAGMASTIGQIGVLLTNRGEPNSAVQHSLRSLALHAALGVPEVRMDLYWLRRQRELLGTERFEVIVRKHASDDDVRTVLRLLDETGASAP